MGPAGGSLLHLAWLGHPLAASSCWLGGAGRFQKALWHLPHSFQQDFKQPRNHHSGVNISLPRGELLRRIYQVNESCPGWIPSHLRAFLTHRAYGCFSLEFGQPGAQVMDHSDLNLTLIDPVKSLGPAPCLLHCLDFLISAGKKGDWRHSERQCQIHKSPRRARETHF